MAKLTLTINTKGLEERTKRYMANIRTKMAEEGQEAAKQLLLMAVERAPDPQTEADMIQFGEGGQGSLEVTNQRQSSTNAGRVRFKREGNDQLPLREAILDPRTWSVSPGGTSIQLGNVARLNEITRFSWVDYSKRTGANEHKTSYGMFSMFEWGANWEVTPSFGDRNYYLNPADYTRVPEMTKHIPEFGMFTLLDTFVVKEAILERLRQVQF